MLVKSNRSPNHLLPFFPAGLPDETIGSRISRYHIRRGQPTAYSTYQQLFERPPFSLTALVQPHLDTLAAKLPGSAKFNLLTLQNESTLLPLCQRFSGTQIALAQAGPSAEIRAIELPRRINGDSTLTHLCAQCLIEDEEAHGCPYIHRAHQIPGVTACWKHATKLLDRCPSCRCPFAQPNQLILSAWLGCTCGYAISDHGRTAQEAPAEIEVEFARFAQVLLTGEPIPLSPAHLVSLYRVRAAELGFGWGDARFNRKALFAQIEAYFGSPLLSRIDAAYRMGKMSGWFHVIGSSAASETPLNRHLILAYFLFRDANLFLSRARAAVTNCELRDALEIRAGHPNHVAGSTKQPEEELLDELVETAQRYGYNAQQLWKHNFGAMKRLVKLEPNACDVIDARLLKAAAQKKQQSTRALRTKERDHQLDQQWSEAINAAATKIYRENQRPIRVTKHRLIRGSNSNSKSVLWPSVDRFPLASAAANANAETTWHFYVRRLLWTLLSLHDPQTPDHKIFILARLEVNKARAVLHYFSDITRGGGASISLISAILDERGIKIDWLGPCPDRSFYKAGRAYRLRTTRRGPIGGRAGDTHQPS